MDAVFGDMVILGKDLRLSYNDETLKDMLNDRIKSTINSYRLGANNVSNIEEFLGLGISNSILKSLELSIISALSTDNLVDSGSITVYIVQTEPNTIYIRINVISPYTQTKITFDRFETIEESPL